MTNSEESKVCPKCGSPIRKGACMQLTAEEMSLEERNRLYGRSMIPFFLAFIIFLIYFNYLMYTDGIRSFWDFITQVGLLLFFPPYTVAMLTFEFLFSRKTRKPFNVKRFASRMLLLLMSVSSLLGFLALVINGVSLNLGEWNAGTLGFVLWLIFFFIVVTKFRRFFTKLTEGSW